jgi:hypothetical protein
VITGAAVALALCLGAAEPEPGATPSNQTLIFYNARMALREGRPADTLKLWLLRNSIAGQGFVGRHDEEFRSVVWAAMGNLGLCQDGYPKDVEGGAGLWPLSVHNWIVYSSRGIPTGPRNPYDAFEAGRQQRFVSLHSELSTAELRTVHFFRTSCYLPETTLIGLGQTPSLDLADRLSTGPFLRQLLVVSLKSLVREKVQSVAAIEARIFDLDLAMAQLLERRARKAGQAAKLRAKTLGISEVGAQEAKEKAMQWPANSSQAAFLRKSLTWETREWLTLNRQRRLFLFAQARPFAAGTPTLDPLVLSMIDSMIDRGEGLELESWIGNFDAKDDPSRRAALTLGERGKRLLELEPASGFRERATVALHRGVAFLEAGSLQESLRSFAYAMSKSEESRDAAVTLSLARRWVSYVLSRYETNEQVIATLKALVPRQEYNLVIEDLIWRAALRADEKSFELVVASLQRGSALDARVLRLRLLAQGKQGLLATQLRDATTDEPHLTLRFARLLLEKLEAEDVDVRRANIPMLKNYSLIFDSLLTSKGGTAKAQSRAAEDLIGRAQGILGGLSLFDTSTVGKARELSPRHETFAGNIRLAPSDPLPWPFEPPLAEPPSAFTPLVLKPVEWRDDKGALVFGWKVTD